jgi:manganese/iron transport system substrate-binding protein
MFQPSRLYSSVQLFCALLLLGLSAIGCMTDPTSEAPAAELSAVDQLPTLTPLTLADGEKIKVVATTNLVADIVAQIGGDYITLYALLAPGVDPHSYTSTPQDLQNLNDADVVFINGLHLETGLDALLVDLAAPVISVNTGVRTRDLAESGHDEAAAEPASHEHADVDPHTWQSVPTVKQWVENIRSTLSQLDPAHAPDYAAAATAYQTQLEALDAEIRQKVATIPATNRKLVTDHVTFGYFAEEYGFTIVGTLIPSLSTAAEPSAQALAALQDQLNREKVPAIFVGTTVNPRLAEQLAQDLGIQVVTLYSDSLSATDGPAATYLDFMRYNVDAIVNALE